MVSVSVLAPAVSGLNATVIAQVPLLPSAVGSQPSAVMLKSTPLASVAGLPVRKPPPALRIVIAWVDGPVPTVREPNATGEAPTSAAEAGPPEPVRAGSLIGRVCHETQFFVTASLAMQKR